MRHVHGLRDDHAHKVLRACDDKDSVHRKGLKNGKGNVACSGRHIHEQIIQLAPDDIRPELLHHARNDRASPDHCLFRIRHQKIQAHNLDAIFRQFRNNLVLRKRFRLFRQSVHLRNGRSCDIRVQNSDTGA